MAVWLPVLKASLPYITQIVTAAIPAFTSKSSKGKPEEIIPTQIAELQTAVTRNAESVKMLATQLQEAIEGIDAAAAKLRQELIVLRRLSALAIILSLIAFSAIAWTFLSKATA